MQKPNRTLLNVNEIDDQHKKLIELVNEFQEAVITEKGEELLHKLLDDLLDETETHYTKEEALLARHQCPYLSVHKEEHNRVSKELIELFKGDSIKEKESSKNTAFLLKDSLIEHINEDVKHLGKFLNSRGVT